MSISGCVDNNNNNKKDTKHIHIYKDSAVRRHEACVIMGGTQGRGACRAVGGVSTGTWAGRNQEELARQRVGMGAVNMLACTTIWRYYVSFCLCKDLKKKKKKPQRDGGRGREMIYTAKVLSLPQDFNLLCLTPEPEDTLALPKRNTESCRGD